MSDVKKLLAEATPLPWSRSGPGPEPDGDQVWLVGNGHQAQFIAWTDASLGAMTDFDLAAYAVNSLPAYEAVSDALQWMLDVFHEYDADGVGYTGFPVKEARVALAAVRGAK